MAALSSELLFMLLLPALLAGFVLFARLERRATLARLNSIMGITAPEHAHSNAVIRGLEWLGAKMPGASDSGIAAILAAAGFNHTAAKPIFVAIRFIGTVCVFLLVLLRKGAPMAADTVLAVFAAFFCSRLFVMVLKLRAETRQRTLRRELPPVVDVLLMVLHSGVSIDQCIRHVAGILEEAAPLSSTVFKRYVSDVDNGMPYEQAFERMGQRFGITEGYDLANLIKQALLQGGEIVGLLERFGADVSDKRIAIAREEIGHKSVQLTFAMLFFFMPVLLITLMGPAVSNIMDTLKTVKQHTLNNGVR